MIKTMPFYCTICEEESTRICVACTKDTCGNHLCEKCGCCSDCCNCELALRSNEVPVATFIRHSVESNREPVPHPHPMPDPDPAPEPFPDEA
jgi:hypothetical protein